MNFSNSSTLILSILDYPPFELTTLYETEIITTFDGKQYSDYLKLNLTKWPVANWIDCDSIDDYYWRKCIDGYVVFSDDYRHSEWK